VWEQPNVTRGEAIAQGLFVAEWALGDEFCRAYGRTQDEAVANVLRQRDEAAPLNVTTGPNPAGFGGADWVKLS
jgi:hypothetical protein